MAAMNDTHTEHALRLQIAGQDWCARMYVENAGVGLRESVITR